MVKPTISQSFLNTNSKRTSSFPADELIHNQPNVRNRLTLEPGTHFAAVSAVSEPMNTERAYALGSGKNTRVNKLIVF